MSRRQLLRSMHARELVEWKALETVDPFGQTREDMRSAVLCSLVANAWMKREDGRKFSPKDFMLDFEEAITTETIPQSPEQIERLMTQWVTANNLRWAGQAATRPKEN